MNELLETERAYVEELLCVLEVGDRCQSQHISAQGPTGFIPPFVKKYEMECLAILINDFYFNGRDMRPRWTTLPWLTLSPTACNTRRTSFLAICLKYTSFIKGKLRHSP